MDRDLVDKQILESSSYFAELYETILSLVDDYKGQYFNAGEELGISHEDIKEAWAECAIDDLVYDIYKKVE